MAATNTSSVPSDAYHHPRNHSAASTDSYLFSQLIPYIGNKRKLLPLIAGAVAHTACDHGFFADLFTGSTVVARLAKTMGFSVLANDWEPYSYEIARGTVTLNAPPPFARLGGPERVFDQLNSLPPLRDYVSRHLCPESDEHPDPDSERMFFTQRNGERIDAMREQLVTWQSSGLISEDELAYVLSALVYSVSYVSNTSGVFKGFHNGWGGKTGTALYRILSTLTLRMPVTFDSGLPNLALREDAQQLSKRLSAVCGSRPSVVYIDPPYNQHPYGSNYHLLNTIVLWDKPSLNPRFRVNGKKVSKSAIRTDWRTQRRSPYNSSASATEAFRELMEGLDARWAIVSYSTDGNIALEDMMAILCGRGEVAVFTRKYKRYRVSTPRMSPKSHNIEFVAAVDLDSRSSRGDAERWAETILAHERAALIPKSAESRPVRLFEL